MRRLKTVAIGVASVAMLLAIIAGPVSAADTSSTAAPFSKVCKKLGGTLTHGFNLYGCLKPDPPGWTDAEVAKLTKSCETALKGTASRQVAPGVSDTVDCTLPA